MEFAQRLQLLTQLQEYILRNDEELIAVKERAERENGFFTQENINKSLSAISHEYLDANKIRTWLKSYPTLPISDNEKEVGIVMAGNIPLVGMHDFIAVFISGHKLSIKLSSKDKVLWQHLLDKMQSWNSEFNEVVQVKEMLKNCDAYIATGSNNTATYFNSYFGKYPNVIRRNRTSVAILNGEESDEELRRLSEDILSYYGLGCRNVTKIFVPNGYDFKLFLDIMKEKEDIIHHNKYKNNYDYHLAIYLLNRIPYLTNDMILLVENEVPFAPIGSLHYEYYDTNHSEELIDKLAVDNDIQSIVSNIKLNRSCQKLVPIGAAQNPKINDYADGVDTLKFLEGLN